jgi:hypothetical protein
MVLLINELGHGAVSPGGLDGLNDLGIVGELGGWL